MLFNVISGLPMQTADFRTPCFILYGGTFTNAEAPIGIFGIVPPIFFAAVSQHPHNKHYALKLGGRKPRSLQMLPEYFCVQL